MLSKNEKIKAVLNFYYKCKLEGFTEITKELYDLPISDVEIDRLYQKVQEIKSKQTF